MWRTFDPANGWGKSVALVASEAERIASGNLQRGFETVLLDVTPTGIGFSRRALDGANVTISVDVDSSSPHHSASTLPKYAHLLRFPLPLLVSMHSAATSSFKRVVLCNPSDHFIIRSCGGPGAVGSSGKAGARGSPGKHSTTNAEAPTTKTEIVYRKGVSDGLFETKMAGYGRRAGKGGDGGAGGDGGDGGIGGRGGSGGRVCVRIAPGKEVLKHFVRVEVGGGKGGEGGAGGAAGEGGNAGRGGKGVSYRTHTTHIDTYSSHDRVFEVSQVQDGQFADGEMGSKGAPGAAGKSGLDGTSGPDGSVEWVSDAGVPARLKSRLTSSPHLETVYIGDENLQGKLDALRQDRLESDRLLLGFAYLTSQSIRDWIERKEREMLERPETYFVTRGTRLLLCPGRLRTDASAEGEEEGEGEKETEPIGGCPWATPAALEESWRYRQQAYRAKWNGGPVPSTAPAVLYEDELAFLFSFGIVPFCLNRRAVNPVRLEEICFSQDALTLRIRLYARFWNKIATKLIKKIDIPSPSFEQLSQACWTSKTRFERPKTEEFVDFVRTYCELNEIKGIDLGVIQDEPDLREFDLRLQLVRSGEEETPGYLCTSVGSSFENTLVQKKGNEEEQIESQPVSRMYGATIAHFRVLQPTRLSSGRVTTVYPDVDEECVVDVCVERNFMSFSGIVKVSLKCDTADCRLLEDDVLIFEEDEEEEEGESLRSKANSMQASIQIDPSKEEKTCCVLRIGVKSPSVVGMHLIFVSCSFKDWNYEVHEVRLWSPPYRRIPVSLVASADVIVVYHESFVPKPDLNRLLGAFESVGMTSFVWDVEFYCFPYGDEGDLSRLLLSTPFQREFSLEGKAVLWLVSDDRPPRQAKKKDLLNAIWKMILRNLSCPQNSFTGDPVSVFVALKRFANSSGFVRMLSESSLTYSAVLLGENALESERKKIQRLLGSSAMVGKDQKLYYVPLNRVQLKSFESGQFLSASDFSSNQVALFCAAALPIRRLFHLSFLQSQGESRIPFEILKNTLIPWHFSSKATQRNVFVLLRVLAEQIRSVSAEISPEKLAALVGLASSLPGLVERNFDCRLSVREIRGSLIELKRLTSSPVSAIGCPINVRPMIGSSSAASDPIEESPERVFRWQDAIPAVLCGDRTGVAVVIRNGTKEPIVLSSVFVQSGVALGNDFVVSCFGRDSFRKLNSVLVQCRDSWTLGPDEQRVVPFSNSSLPVEFCVVFRGALSGHFWGCAIDSATRQIGVAVKRKRLLGGALKAAAVWRDFRTQRLSDRDPAPSSCAEVRAPFEEREDGGVENAGVFLFRVEEMDFNVTC